MEDRIITMAKALGRAVSMDERCAELLAAQKANDEDAALQKEIEHFTELREQLTEELHKEEGSRELINSLNKEAEEVYAAIMASAGMLRYAAAKKEADDMLNWVFAILRTAAGGGDPDAVEKPSAACDGSCSSCSGCH